ncbi:type ISP restriction/modification enzyme [Streptomyces sp. H27-D2]|uniref:type ISP restriction/modification enzyme n=1 Tax=Streptomyces sp. H27-D2 TaxID=3046304 RepID=UPI002DB93E61|nr:type ISP restriction/modification enzyme [Streptomyces sp. H27-D2]MEC4018545.1 type ISP restriction/modification enzyme [Streptomyces sp. H27-D2]
MPWAVAPVRLGRGWVAAPDAASLRGRWSALLAAGDETARAALFGPTRSRTPHSSVAQLPGHRGGTGRLARETGPCPEPVRVLYGPYDQQWLLPDHRLIDAARPELWRVADGRQIFALEPGCAPQAPGPALALSALLPAGRSGRVRPLYRRPGQAEPNLAPGLLDRLAERLQHPVTAEDFLGWAAASARHSPGGCAVPLTADPEVWASGVALGRRALWLQTRGARGEPPEGAPGPRPRMPGGRRPFVRAPLPAQRLPDSHAYDPDEETLSIGEGRISPVPLGAWDFHAGGVRVLDAWFESRTTPREPGTLRAIGPAGWPQEWTSELLELITVLALLAELRPEQHALAARLAAGPRVSAAELREAGVLPAPAAARRPASVLDHHEEGPEGQFALL